MKKYVQVGCGIRGRAYNLPLTNGTFSDCAELCGLYDINHKRAELASELCQTHPKVFNNFDEMLNEVKPDTVIVTCKDCDHDNYIIKSLNAGCDVISEKPLTTTFSKALAIQKAERTSGKKVYVTFNLRFSPFYLRVKELLKSGIIGEIFSVHVEWMLDTSHGADYFRRWHRLRENSGSLLVHKSTHHFDLVNWYLEQEPLYVNAFGKRRFYGSNQISHGERCLSCPKGKNCNYYFDINASGYNRLYRDCEDVDGYFRDRCIFSDQIDIEDTISVNVEYSKGALLTYSLNAHSPYEGHVFTFNGSEGRLEVTNFNTTNAVDFNQTNNGNSIRLFNRKGELIQYHLPSSGSGGHGGADPLMREGLFRGIEEDTYTQFADTWDGMVSIGIGMAANISMAEKRRVSLSEFYEELKRYDD